MKFENKGKWIKQINESAQKNEARSVDKDSVISRNGKYYHKIYGYEVELRDGKFHKVNPADTASMRVFNKQIDDLAKSKTNATAYEKELRTLAKLKYTLYSLKNAYDNAEDDATKLKLDTAIKQMKDKIAAQEKVVGANKKNESAQKNENDLSISAMLDFSLSEENDAVANYEKRAAKCLEHGNTKLADLFKELARDEKVHVAQLTKAKELLGLADNEIEQEGSDEAKEILVDSSQKNEASTFAKDKGLYEKKTKQNAIRYIYNKINTKGIFRDTDWSGLRKVTDQIRNLGVDLTIAPTNDSWHKSGYAVNDKNIPTEKRYDIEISFRNIDNKEIVIKGQIACQGAGSVKDPLDAYDIVMTLY